MSGRPHPVLDSALIADDDALLIVAIQSRDRAALERLYLGYHPRLARFLARMAARSAWRALRAPAGNDAR